MRARYIKFVIWIIALVVVWNLGQSYAVTNSLFIFAAAGVVPGTDITLRPDQVLALLGAVLALAFLLIFGTDLRRGLRALFRRRPAVSAEAAMPVQAPAAAVAVASPLNVATKVRGKRPKAAKSRPVIIIEPPRRPSKVLLLLHVAFTTVSMTLRAHFEKARDRWGKVHSRWPVVVAALGRGYRRAKVAAGQLAARLRRGLIRATIAVCRAAIRFWRWLEPRLRRFDAWLGIRYHRFLDTAKRNDSVKLVMGFAREAGKVVADIAASLRAALGRATEK